MRSIVAVLTSTFLIAGALLQWLANPVTVVGDHLQNLMQSRAFANDKRMLNDDCELPEPGFATTMTFRKKTKQHTVRATVNRNADPFLKVWDCYANKLKDETLRMSFSLVPSTRKGNADQEKLEGVLDLKGTWRPTFHREVRTFANQLKNWRNMVIVMNLTVDTSQVCAAEPEYSFSNDYTFRSTKDPAEIYPFLLNDVSKLLDLWECFAAKMLEASSSRVKFLVYIPSSSEVSKKEEEKILPLEGQWKSAFTDVVKQMTSDLDIPENSFTVRMYLEFEAE